MGFVGGAGFANLDLLYAGLEKIPEEGQEVYAREFDMQLGGGVPATMINLSRLGIDSKLLTFAGKDFFSQFVTRALEGYGVQTINLYKGSGRPITLSSVMVCGGDRSIVSYQDRVEITPHYLEQVYRQLHGAKIGRAHV